MYILTYTVKDYNQHGEYFLACFSVKPTIEQLQKVTDLQGMNKVCQDLLDSGVSESGEYYEYQLEECEDLSL